MRGRSGVRKESSGERGCGGAGGKSVRAGEGWVGLPCARRDKMAPAAPCLAGAMMGLGEGWLLFTQYFSPCFQKFLFHFSKLGEKQGGLAAEALEFPGWGEKCCGHRSGRFSDWGAGSLGREEGGDGFCDGQCSVFVLVAFPCPVIFLCVWFQDGFSQRRLVL